MVSEQQAVGNRPTADAVSIDSNWDCVAKRQGTLLEIIKSSLSAGENVLVSGFGKFCVKEKKKRKGRNPATGDEMMLDDRRVVTFKCSGKLRDKIN
ncbi:MAG: integration host factor subunit alpha [Desulfosarcina sp.]|nr:integration host factor subunit alpha [Desulfosarcina sp.]